jgi:hypothetical protein
MHYHILRLFNEKAKLVQRVFSSLFQNKWNATDGNCDVATWIRSQEMPDWLSLEVKSSGHLSDLVECSSSTSITCLWARPRRYRRCSSSWAVASHKFDLIGNFDERSHQCWIGNDSMEGKTLVIFRQFVNTSHLIYIICIYWAYEE